MIIKRYFPHGIIKFVHVTFVHKTRFLSLWSSQEHRRHPLIGSRGKTGTKPLGLWVLTVSRGLRGQSPGYRVVGLGATWWCV